MNRNSQALQMVMTGNTRTKRKNSSHDLKTEPALKALKKSDIIIQFEALQKKYDALEKQNEVLLQEKSDHIESIHLLEETVKILEVKSSKVEIENKNASKKASETQTEDVDMMRCDECDYPAQDICDLGAHIHEVHGSESFEEVITCNYCQEKSTGRRYIRRELASAVIFLIIMVYFEHYLE